MKQCFYGENLMHLNLEFTHLMNSKFLCRNTLLVLRHKNDAMH